MGSTWLLLWRPLYRLGRGPGLGRWRRAGSRAGSATSTCRPTSWTYTCWRRGACSYSRRPTGFGWRRVRWWNLLLWWTLLLLGWRRRSVGTGRRSWSCSWGEQLHAARRTSWSDSRGTCLGRLDRHRCGWGTCCGRTSRGGTRRSNSTTRRPRARTITRAWSCRIRTSSIWFRIFWLRSWEIWWCQWRN